MTRNILENEFKYANALSKRLATNIIVIHHTKNARDDDMSAAQIESATFLIADLCAKYKISIYRKYILGHRDLMATICSGKNLYNQLDVIIAKANGYETPADDIEKIAILA